MASLKISKFPSVPNRVATNKFTRPRSSLARPQLSTPQCRPTVQLCSKKTSVYTTEEKRVECSLLSTSGSQGEKNVRNRRVASYPSSATSGGLNKRYVDRGEYVAKDEYLTISTSLKELEKRFEDVTLQLQKSENEVKSLKEQMNKSQRNAETQTHGIRTEELEKSLQQLSDQNRSLSVELRSSDLQIAKFKRDIQLKNDKLVSTENQLKSNKTQLKFTEEQLKRKSEELKSVTEQNLVLLGINEDEKKKNIVHLERIDNLWKSRNEFKIGYLDASKERDDATEAAFELKHKLTKMEKLVDKYASEEKQRRANYVHHSLELSELVEKNKKLHEENTKSKEIISTLEQTVQKCLDENTESTEKIVELEETISELKDEIRSWETGVECKLSTVIRNEFQPRFDEKNSEIVRLNRKLNKAVANNSVKLACLEKNNEVKQATIDMQQGVIKLLKDLKEEPSPTNQNLLRLHQRMDDFLLEYEDILSFMNSKFYRNWLKENSY